MPMMLLRLGGEGKGDDRLERQLAAR